MENITQCQSDVAFTRCVVHHN